MSCFFYVRKLHLMPKGLTYCFLRCIMQKKLKKQGDKMNRIVSRILIFITKQNVISNDEEVQNFYKYGIEISISSLLNIFLVVCLGLIIHHVIESIIFISIFILIRSFTGGYHANTYFKCNLLMCVTYILIVSLNIILSNRITLPIVIGLVCFNLTVVWILGPVENKNKPIEQFRRTKLKVIGTIISIIINCIGIILIKSYIGTMIIFTCVSISILMLAAIIKEKRGDVYE